MYYPLFFKPVYKEIIWGGRNLERVFLRELPAGKVAESWEVCCHKNGMSVVAEGILAGRSLKDLLQQDELGLLGARALDCDRFPLLIKFLDANDKLSVQVHPDNEYGLRVEGDLGKTEMWYILEAKPGAQLIYGVRSGVTREIFRDALLKGKLEECLNFVNVKKGDCFYIPAGTVHAILDGIMIAEIQQNSDTTYRVYDWNRVDKNGSPRELHIDKALDVINFEFKREIKEAELNRFNGYTTANLVRCEYFSVDKIDVSESYTDKTDLTTFHIYNVVEGEGEVIHDGKSYKIKAGVTFMIPAAMGEYCISGKVVLLKSYL